MFIIDVHQEVEGSKLFSLFSHDVASTVVKHTPLLRHLKVPTLQNSELISLLLRTFPAPQIITLAGKKTSEKGAASRKAIESCIKYFTNLENLIRPSGFVGMLLLLF